MSSRTIWNCINGICIFLLLSALFCNFAKAEKSDDFGGGETDQSEGGGVDLGDVAGGATRVYTNQWAAHIRGGEGVARDLAQRHGFILVTKILDDYYLFRHRRLSRRSLNATSGSEYLESFAHEPRVLWMARQEVKRRVKRDFVRPSDRGSNTEKIRSALEKRDVDRAFTDPKWPRMWYLNRGRGLDMNVMPAWLDGYTGRGVVVSILDDGIEKDHPDIKRNYDPEASYDVNDHDNDPQPRYEYSNENRHGTRCAGEVAAEANNAICSAGVAYEAKIGGVRMLDGDVTDAVEAQSLSLNPQHIDIYSASWGPDDDGQTVDGPGPLARKAFVDGINFGRGGKGSIYVWASGNGGREGDSCNCDGYTNSIYTLSMSSATENGQVPWYSEACSSTLATTYSSGSGSERQIVTTDLRKGCTELHTGTSASAPLAAGICALVLQANRQLTWRDLQHLVVITSRQANLEADDWITNGVGRRVSHYFGYGLLDVEALVGLSKNWTNVSEQRRCEILSRQAARGIPVNGAVEVSLESDGCRGSVVYVEHVQAVITLSASRRGEVEVFLTSPRGTRSTLLAKRSRDVSTEGFYAWAFMTTHFWGEDAFNTWRLEVRNGASVSTLKNWTLVLYGTSTLPRTYQSLTPPAYHRGDPPPTPYRFHPWPPHGGDGRNLPSSSNLASKLRPCLDCITATLFVACLVIVVISRGGLFSCRIAPRIPQTLLPDYFLDCVVTPSRSDYFLSRSAEEWDSFPSWRCSGIPTPGGYPNGDFVSCSMEKSSLWKQRESWL